jgi:hypothetical protein
MESVQRCRCAAACELSERDFVPTSFVVRAVRCRCSKLLADKPVYRNHSPFVGWFWYVAVAEADRRADTWAWHWRFGIPAVRHVDRAVRHIPDDRGGCLAAVAYADR